VDLIRPAQYGDQWLDLMNTAMNLRVSGQWDVSSTEEYLSTVCGSPCKMWLPSWMLLQHNVDSIRIPKDIELNLSSLGRYNIAPNSFLVPITLDEADPDGRAV